MKQPMNLVLKELMETTNLRKKFKKEKWERLLEEAVAAKDQCEKILMCKFVKILNAKKRKIAELLAEQSVSDQPDCTVNDVDSEAKCKTFEEVHPTTSNKIDEQSSRSTATHDSVGRSIDNLLLRANILLIIEMIGQTAKHQFTK
uniref:Uncharacterized protein n=1 Tax=Romanomermis culicivorax TaxID=13658 RepID=A0A915IM50_ROMCU